MINDTKLEKFIEQLETYIEEADKDKHLVSPTHRASGGVSSPEALIITPDLDVDKLNKEQLVYVHAMLHRFYANKTNKILDLSDIENLHKKVTQKITHTEFDKLDEVA